MERRATPEQRRSAQGTRLPAAYPARHYLAFPARVSSSKCRDFGALGFVGALRDTGCVSRWLACVGAVDRLCSCWGGSRGGGRCARWRLAYGCAAVALVGTRPLARRPRVLLWLGLGSEAEAGALVLRPASLPVDAAVNVHGVVLPSKIDGPDTRLPPLPIMFQEKIKDLRIFPQATGRGMRRSEGRKGGRAAS